MTPRIIDLSYPIHEGMTTFPVHWHLPVEITQLARHGIENRETRKIVMGTHCGTHIDAPRHFIPNGPTIDTISLDLLVGPARVLNFTPITTAKQRFDVDDFASRLGDERPLRLILRFDWSDHWGTMKYYSDQPYISEEAAQWLVDRGVRLLAMDTPQVDSPDHGRTGPKDSPNHKIMLGQGCIFVEYCTNLRQLTRSEVELVVAPLNILGSDGSPARVMAIER
ncbi:MAG TPA: cyclase family protein [Vicinamibacterales bacterium]|nr:cyclase family protein [Vicinamibacterales bacterium]